MQHRFQSLAKAQELSNNRSGYNTATYTGSGMSTPRSAYSRTKKFRGSLGSLSDCDLKSRSEVLTVDLNNSRSNLSDRSSTARKTQVSFRNEEYNKMASANVKRRKSYMGMTKKRTSILRKGHKISAAGSDNSESSGTINSANKQADTGYDGSVSSGPSQATLAHEARKSIAASDLSISSNVSANQNVDFPIITHTVSKETNPGRLSVVASMDEQSLIHETTYDDQTNADSLKSNTGNYTNNVIPLGVTTSEDQDIASQAEHIEETTVAPQADVNFSDTPTDKTSLLNNNTTDQISANPNENVNVTLENNNSQSDGDEKVTNPQSKVEPLPDLPPPMENGSVVEDLNEPAPNSSKLTENNIVNMENLDIKSSQQHTNDHLTNDPSPDLPKSQENGIINNDAEIAKSNVIVVANSQIITKSDSVSSMNQLVNITSSSEVNNGITAVE